MIRRIMIRSIIKIVFLVSLTSFLISCTDNEYAIFYYIEHENEQVDNSLPNNTSISGMGLASSYYYVSAGGAMYSRYHADDVANWFHVSLPRNAVNCTSMTISDVGGPELIYAGFLMTDGSYEFYEGDPNRNPSWSEIDDPKVGGKQIVWVKQISAGAEQLFVVVLDSGKYNLYYCDNPPTGNFEDALLDQSAIIRDITYDASTGSERFWVITDTKVFTFDGTQVSGLFSEKTNNTNLKDHGGYMDVYWCPDYNTCYISTIGGVIYESGNGDDWTSSGAKSVGDSEVPFTSFTVLAGNVLVGTVGFGFYEMQDGSVSDLSRLTEFTANELYYGWIYNFFIDSDKVFCLTGGSGLWRNVYDSGTWGDWVWE